MVPGGANDPRPAQLVHPGGEYATVEPLLQICHSRVPTSELRGPPLGVKSAHRNGWSRHVKTKSSLRPILHLEVPPPMETQNFCCKNLSPFSEIDGKLMASVVQLLFTSFSSWTMSGYQQHISPTGAVVAVVALSHGEA